MPKPHKISGDSPAAEACYQIFQSQLHLPDASPIFAAMGAITANYLQGNPVWLMLVGPPSTGKTVIIKACSTLPDCHPAPSAQNASAFLTFDAKRGHGGLLSQPRIENGENTGGMGNFGIIVYPEFSSVLNLPPDSRAFVSAIHREIFDGKWKRDFGSNGGRVLEWEGKAGALAGVTAAIDRHAMAAELGERWLYYRFPAPDHMSQSRVAGEVHAEDPVDRSAILSAAVLDLFRVSGIKPKQPARLLEHAEHRRMAYIVRAGCYLRGTVARDSHSREIVDLPQTEGSGRIFSSLASIYLALELLGLRNKWCWKICRKIAFDSAPALRAEIVKRCLDLQRAKPPHPITPANLSHLLHGLSDGVIRRTIEDLKMLRILVKDGKEPDEKMAWKLDEGVEKLLLDMEEDL